MSAACTPEQRAREVEKAIWAAVDRGEIILENGVYQREDPDGCHACAVGSAARAICGIRSNMPNSMRAALAAKGVMSMTESCVMEAGFEQGDFNREGMLSYFVRGTNMTHLPTVDEASFDAFANLGRRLRARQRPAP